MSNTRSIKVKIITPGRQIDPKVLRFQCLLCGCEFEVNELDCCVSIQTVYSDGVAVFVNNSAAEAMHTCPTRGCENTCRVIFEREFKGE